jgi:outer membrane protein OmpA-like peptidoglycan-associated protein
MGKYLIVLIIAVFLAVSSFGCATGNKQGLMDEKGFSRGFKEELKNLKYIDSSEPTTLCNNCGEKKSEDLAEVNRKLDLLINNKNVNETKIPEGTFSAKAMANATATATATAKAEVSEKIVSTEEKFEYVSRKEFEDLKKDHNVLKGQFKQTDASVEAIGQMLTDYTPKYFRFWTDTPFAEGSAILPDAMKKEIDNLVEQIKKKNYVCEIIEGSYNANTGSIDKNQTVGLQRAEAAKKYLQERGIDVSGISVRLRDTSNSSGKNTLGKCSNHRKVAFCCVTKK